MCYVVWVFSPVVCCWGFCCWTGVCLRCLNLWFRWVLLDILGVLVCLLSGSHCFGFVLSAVFLRLVCVFVAAGVCSWTWGGALGFTASPETHKHTSTGTGTSFGEKEHRTKQHTSSFCGVVVVPVSCQFVSGKKNERTPPPKPQKIGDVIFLGGAYLPYEKPLLPPKTGLR